MTEMVDGGRIPGPGFAQSAILFTLLFAGPLYAACPAPEGTTLSVRASVGNLIIDTTGRDSVTVEVNNPQIRVQENCGSGQVGITSNDPGQIEGGVEWKITVPRAIHLDLVTYAGSITVGDADGNATVRTQGGSVTVGQIQGRAAIITQGGSIKSGDIGADAELRSRGGSLEVGNVAGNAELETGAGPIVAGIINGQVRAVTAGGSITIRGSGSAVVAITAGGDISVGDAAQIDARTTDGGNITSRRVRGSFQGRAESGDIRLDSAGSWVEAHTGFGNILVRLMPQNPDAALHVDLQTGIGDVTIYLPQTMNATIEAAVDRPAFEAQRIFSDFPMRGFGPNPASSRLLSPLRSQTTLNGGGNPVRLHTSLGKIEIRKN